MKTLILLLTQDRLAVYAEPAAPSLLAEFGLDDAGQQAWAAWLAARGPYRCFVLTDLVEEDVLQEEIPRLGGRDRQALLQRRLAQQFRATAYRQARLLRRGRRGEPDRVQLAALLNGELLERVMAPLLTRQWPVVGVYSLALLTQALLERIPQHPPQVLVMSSLRPGQWRQSFFTHEGLRFSRLAIFNASHASQPDEQLHDLASELHRARQYLSTLRLVGRDVRLPVWLLVDGPQLAAMGGLSAALGEEAGAFDLQLQTPQGELAQRLRLPVHSEHWLESLLRLLVSGKLANQYAPAAVLKYDWLYRLGRHLYQWAVVLVLLAAGLAAISWWQATQLQQQLGLAEQRWQHLQREEREYSQRLHGAAASAPLRLQTMARFTEQHLQAAPDPERTLQAVSQVLLGLPGLTLDEVQWQTLAPAVLADAAANGAVPAEPQVADPQAQPNPWLAQQLTLRGRVADRQAHRQSLQQVRALQEALQHDLAAVQISVVQWPLDIRSKASIQPQLNQVADSRAIPADFVLQLNWPTPELTHE
ncbi:hypothetical protein [Chitinibacter tainanensis]|uniref:hypothetical protein n=1 Tax=Chitinibacter tainanensis TaxID=230667 RepID=UPI0023525592|nr:hypothetical protein [Chitinibacter tainanensis]